MKKVGEKNYEKGRDKNHKRKRIRRERESEETKITKERKSEEGKIVCEKTLRKPTPCNVILEEGRS